MKKLVILAIVVVAAWTAWKRYPELMERTPSHEAVIENRADDAIVSLRLTVGGKTMVKEELATGAKATFPFRVDRDSDFRLLWEWKSRQGESHWTGGYVTAGPIVARHMFVIDDDGGVILRSEPKSAAK